MSAQQFNILQLVGEDQARVSYRPRLRTIVNSVTGVILLQQLIYWWTKVGNRPFYKFVQPCKHELYKDGDSWTEELGFSYAEFSSALKQIGAKVTKGTSKTELLKNNMVIYWTDSGRVTWYQLNEALVAERISQVYSLGNSAKSNYLEPEQSADTFSTETTTETTTNTPPTAGDAAPTPANLEQWLEGAEKAKNRSAYLRWYVVTLFPYFETDLNEMKCKGYARVGGVAKQIGGMGYCMKLLWQAAGQRITGDPLRYVVEMKKNGRKVNGCITTTERVELATGPGPPITDALLAEFGLLDDQPGTSA